LANWLGKFRDRHIALWQAGKIDDRAFEAAQVRRTRVMVGLGFVALLVAVDIVVVIGNLSDHTPLRLEQLLLVSGFLVFFGVLLAFRVGRLAKVGARNMVLARNRARIEANPALGLSKAAREGAALPARYFGTHKRSIRHACTVLGLSGVGFVLVGGLAYWYDTNGYEFSPIVAMLGVAFVGIAIYGLYMIADRRVYLELSAEGIWCRAWGKERFPFSQFKAVYGRQRNIQHGVVFVPRNPDEFRKRLSFWTGLYFRSGGGVKAHARTVTLWTTQVDLPRDALLREVQSAVVRAAQG
jgi:hypothetical protein